MSTETELRALLDKQACIELVYRFARGLDRMDGDIIRSVFHPDGWDDHGIFNGPVDEYVPWVLEVLATMKITQHHIGNVLIELRGADLAVGETYYVAHHELPDQDGKMVHYTAAGRYLDRFERRGGEWRIAKRLAVSEWSAQAPSSNNWDRLAGPRTYGKRDRTDAVYGF